jgi:hypothetical protein
MMAGWASQLNYYRFSMTNYLYFVAQLRSPSPQLTDSPSLNKLGLQSG